KRSRRGSITASPIPAPRPAANRRLPARAAIRTLTFRQLPEPLPDFAIEKFRFGLLEGPSPGTIVGVSARPARPRDQARSPAPAGALPGAPWHFLSFFPLPHGQGAFRPTFAAARR